MNKKILAAGAGLAVLALSASFVLTTGKTGATTLAGEVTHSHGSPCTIHHYAQDDPTSEKSGVKEYWICCSDPTHKVSFSNPGVGNITDATHGGDFVIDSSDDRYIAPYTFPEVFSSQMAYDTPVTVANGKVTSSTGAVHIKGSVLKDAYSHGYTHMKFHSNAASSDVTNVLGTQDTWQSYYKRYKNDQDNRYWLKSFSTASQGLKIDSLNLGAHVDTELTLSDFALYKSSFTETWGGGTDCNRYIALENGELVFDNSGNKKWTVTGTIPAEIMGTEWANVNILRAFYVKKVALGGFSDTSAYDAEQINVTASDGSSWMPYKFSRTSDGAESKNSEGFSNMCYNGVASDFGLHPNYYYGAGAMSIMPANPGAYAIRINYDLYSKYKSTGFTYDVTPNSFSPEGKFRVSLTNVIGATKSQSNIYLPNSVDHKGINLKITSTFSMYQQMRIMDGKPSGTYVDMSTGVTSADGVYTWSGAVNFTNAETNPGCYIIVMPNEDLTSENAGTMTFEYSWID